MKKVIRIDAEAEEELAHAIERYDKGRQVWDLSSGRS
jgi:hypothetical protein